MLEKIRQTIRHRIEKTRAQILGFVKNLLISHNMPLAVLSTFDISDINIMGNYQIERKKLEDKICAFVDAYNYSILRANNARNTTTTASNDEIVKNDIIKTNRNAPMGDIESELSSEQTNFKLPEPNEAITKALGKLKGKTPMAKLSSDPSSSEEVFESIKVVKLNRKILVTDSKESNFVASKIFPALQSPKFSLKLSNLNKSVIDFSGKTPMANIISDLFKPQILEKLSFDKFQTRDSRVRYYSQIFLGNTPMVKLSSDPSFSDATIEDIPIVNYAEKSHLEVKISASLKSLGSGCRLFNEKVPMGITKLELFTRMRVLLISRFGSRIRDVMQLILYIKNFQPWRVAYTQRKLTIFGYRKIINHLLIRKEARAACKVERRVPKTLYFLIKILNDSGFKITKGVSPEFELFRLNKFIIKPPKILKRRTPVANIKFKLFSKLPGFGESVIIEDMKKLNWKTRKENIISELFKSKIPRKLGFGGFEVQNAKVESQLEISINIIPMAKSLFDLPFNDNIIPINPSTQTRANKSVAKDPGKLDEIFPWQILHPSYLNLR